jgi:hypothetical protein
VRFVGHDTPTRNFSIRPAVLLYCRDTPTDFVPFFK